MSAVSRAYTFTDGTDAFGSQVENEFTTIYNAWNNHNSGTSIWTSLKAALLTMSGNVVMATNKITGLGNGTAVADAAAFGQLKVIQIVSATDASATTTSSTSYINTSLTATITPTSSSNKVLMIVSGNVNLVSTSLNVRGFITVFRAGADLNGHTQGFQSVANVISSATSAMIYPVNIIYLDSPASTSATTYTVHVRTDSGSLSLAWGQSGNGTALTTSIILVEVVA